MLYTHKTEPNGSLKSFYIGKESASQISSLTVFLIISSTYSFPGCIYWIYCMKSVLYSSDLL